MPPTSRDPRRGLAAAVLALALVPASYVVPASSSAAATADRPAVIGRRVIGHSVQGRPLVAWHLGEPGRRRVVLLAVMHGDEGAPRRILTDLRDGPPVHDLNLWVVPVYNPDGLAAGTRKNAHGVDLNRNYPYRWIPQSGGYESGPRPASEPETRAMMRFLARVHPSYVLSFHQPLHAVDVTERPRFSRRVARALGLPMTRLDCGSTCHGTMTMWFDHRFPGFALTVEYGASPSRATLRAAPDKILRLFGAWRGGVVGVPRSG
ncbi:M14 family zinc carboxypeptidase [Nocardioides cynanchi]|uniref:M14 family zinc carboxypeptidase n=1 Tax=Nocardioides cynanchi TaxID=2558918 RepID=UPI0012459B4E|nr:M14 family zinc carboxypeptidase [Nocardioides cynanchi]